MSALPVVLSDPDDVNKRVRELGVTPGILHDALLAGELARASCTANDPLSYPGTSAWAVTTRSLREQLIPRGWEKNDGGNYARVLNPDRGISIVVATGDEDTGREHGSPRTKCPKGTATIEAIEANMQFDLFLTPEELLKRRAAARRPQAYITWILLLAKVDEQLRAELSRPAGIGEDGRIISWSERIILPPIDPDNEHFLRAPAPEPGPDFDVDVIRRIG